MPHILKLKRGKHLLNCCFGAFTKIHYCSLSVSERPQMSLLHLPVSEVQTQCTFGIIHWKSVFLVLHKIESVVDIRAHKMQCKM